MRFKAESNDLTHWEDDVEKRMKSLYSKWHGSMNHCYALVSTYYTDNNSCYNNPSIYGLRFIWVNSMRSSSDYVLIYPTYKTRDSALKTLVKEGKTVHKIPASTVMKYFECGYINGDCPCYVPKINWVLGD